MRARGRSTLLLALVLAACESAKTREAGRVDKALSWVATSGAVARSWAENRVPARYAERTLVEARDALSRQGESDVIRVVNSLIAVVRAGDRAAASAPLAALSAHWSALEARSRESESGR